jgi:hypothetical protein
MHSSRRLSRGKAKPQIKKITATPLSARREASKFNLKLQVKINLTMIELKSSRGLKRPAIDEELIK